MGHTITAIYENGMLRLLEPLPYPEHTQVELAVRRIEPTPAANQQRERTRQVLLDAGLLVEITDTLGAPTLSEAERMRRAQALADAGVLPLSAAIIDERESQ